MKEFKLQFSDIDFSHHEVFHALYRDSEPNPEIIQMLQEMLRELELICRPRFSFQIFEQLEMIGTSQMKINGHLFTMGRIIRNALEAGDRLYVVVATAGEEFDRWLKELNNQGDILKSYLADTIGSEIAEATMRRASLEIKNLECDTNISNSYSPGYCNWHVSQQQILFSMLDGSPSGVTLSPSSLMHPIKSVSSMIVAGDRVELKPYGCQICSMENCFRNKK